MTSLNWICFQAVSQKSSSSSFPITRWLVDPRAAFNATNPVTEVPPEETKRKDCPTHVILVILLGSDLASLERSQLRRSASTPAGFCRTKITTFIPVTVVISKKSPWSTAYHFEIPQNCLKKCPFKNDLNYSRGSLPLKKSFHHERW